MKSFPLAFFVFFLLVNFLDATLKCWQGREGEDDECFFNHVPSKEEIKANCKSAKCKGDSGGNGKCQRMQRKYYL